MQGFCLFHVLVTSALGTFCFCYVDVLAGSFCTQDWIEELIYQIRSMVEDLQSTTTCVGMDDTDHASEAVAFQINIKSGFW